MSTVLAILANIDRIENSWNGQSSQLSAWCTEARGFVESEIIGKLGSRLGKTATGHTSYIFPREVFEIVNEWFANLASETGPLKSIQDPRDLVSLLVDSNRSRVNPYFHLGRFVANPEERFHLGFRRFSTFGIRFNRREFLHLTVANVSLG
jgi:hypothetical protein